MLASLFLDAKEFYKSGESKDCRGIKK